ncbi:LysR family transcriptional regulator [Vagococcus xieshaowenii]|uniref:LysR family transcriptional regulator n=1 Tax=Vagococcus xieshaowenii TaxID=2562451 RepID=A0A4Z0D7M6_9ENTE|nr:LysR family transcriptional regulator [Vagococcus xieshaowenii]QCA29137.1 LysR family transcriptional regulator [Vagococcus xieshaowenii]TFZ40886.1 LysR family transcriptional regulator [Vagococcus xieshaowenii]
MFTWIETFLSVYETRSFTKSADLLFISQPSVSVHIKKLEQHMNVPLFIRGGNHQLVPTEHADFLYPKLQLIKDDWQDLVRDAKELPMIKKDVTLALSNTNALKIIPKILPALLLNFPMINFQLIETNSNNVLTMLEQHQADIGLIEDDLIHPQLNREVFYQDDLVLCGDKNAPYWLIREQASGTYHYQDSYLKKHNLQPNFIKVNSNEMIVELLSEGIGQTIISNLLINNHDNIPIQQIITTRHLSIAWRKSNQDEDVLSIIQQIKNNFA